VDSRTSACTPPSVKDLRTSLTIQIRIYVCAGLVQPYKNNVSLSHSQYVVRTVKGYSTPRRLLYNINCVMVYDIALPTRPTRKEVRGLLRVIIFYFTESRVLGLGVINPGSGVLLNLVQKSFGSNSFLCDKRSFTMVINSLAGTRLTKTFPPGARVEPYFQRA
jgi:hypothetical protein